MVATLPSTVLGLALLLAGVALCLCSAMAALVWRNAGVTLEALWSAGSSAAAHPDRYIRPDRVRAFRVLSTAGVGLFLAGALVSFIQGLWRIS
jgi:hypothetical protein